jgi:hypothetical protein
MVDRVDSLWARSVSETDAIEGKLVQLTPRIRATRLSAVVIEKTLRFDRLVSAFAWHMCMYDLKSLQSAWDIRASRSENM